MSEIRIVTVGIGHPPERYSDDEAYHIMKKLIGRRSDASPENSRVRPPPAVSASGK